MGRTGLAAALVVCALAIGCGRGGLLDPAAPPSGGGGAAGSDGAGGLEGSPAPPVPVAGKWLMYGFEDHDTALFEVGPDGRSYEVSGVGCFHGWKSLFEAPIDLTACGDLHGHGAGLDLDVAFHVDGDGGVAKPANYTASLHVSKDGTRMAGTLTIQLESTAPIGPIGPFGWLRLEDIGVTGPLDQLKDQSADVGPLAAAPWSDARGFSVRLRDGAPLGSLVPGKTYHESLSPSVVYSLTGDLGAFWGPDFHWEEATRTLTAGPAPETIPGTPVKLALHLDAVSTTVLDVVATMADGSTGTLVPVSQTP
jgi:hypothetical protein